MRCGPVDRSRMARASSGARGADEQGQGLTAKTAIDAKIIHVGGHDGVGAMQFRKPEETGIGVIHP